ncbi:MAG: hypothetical protein PHP28_07315 [Actinomycetota bacterium]|nr:hypothetical protein [Actinomycetota bacterium]MDD5667841.1 hypothetical protein [Actinomycetota bacterium]
MRCPLCGADNSERAESCYLCQNPLDPEPPQAAAPARDTAAGQQYPPQDIRGDMGPSGPQAVSPPPMGPGGYQPPPPGAYPAGFQPTPPAPEGPAKVKIVIGILVVLLIALVGVGLYFFLRTEPVKIVAPAPPGFTAAEGDLVDDLKDTMKAGSEGIDLDELYVDATMTNFIIVAHQDIPITFGSDKPPVDDPEAMERWFHEYKDEWVGAFNAGIVEGAGIPVDIDIYEVERLTAGDAALHMTTRIDALGTPFMVDTLWVIKEGTAFFILVEGLDSGSEAIEFLRDNISFEE